MGLALYIVLDKADPGFDTFVNGKVISKETEKLDMISRQLDIPTFDSFISMSSEDFEDLLGDEVDIPPQQDIQWFSGEDGLSFIETLTQYLRANPTSVNNPSAVLDDLDEYAAVFRKAKEIGAKWHLNIDI